MIPSIAPSTFSPAALAQAIRDTVFVVQREPGWQTWIEALAAISTIVVAIGLLVLGFALIFAGLKVRQLVRKVEEQAQVMVTQTELISTPETDENGLLTISDELQEQSVASLALTGIELDADELFDTTLIDEVYEEHPELLEG